MSKPYFMRRESVPGCPWRFIQIDMLSIGALWIILVFLSGFFAFHADLSCPRPGRKDGWRVNNSQRVKSAWHVLILDTCKKITFLIFSSMMALFSLIDSKDIQQHFLNAIRENDWACDPIFTQISWFSDLPYENNMHTFSCVRFLFSFLQAIYS